MALDRDLDCTPILRTAAERRGRVVRNAIALRTPRITRRIQTSRQLSKCIQHKSAQKLRFVPRNILLHQRIVVIPLPAQHSGRRHSPGPICLNIHPVVLPIQTQRHARTRFPRTAERRLRHIRQTIRITHTAVTVTIQTTRERRRWRQVNLDLPGSRRRIPGNVSRTHHIGVLTLIQPIDNPYAPVPISPKRDRITPNHLVLRVPQLDAHRRTRLRRTHKHRSRFVGNPVIIEKASVRSRAQPRRDERLRIQCDTAALHLGIIPRAVRRKKTERLIPVTRERVDRHTPTTILPNRRIMPLTVDFQTNPGTHLALAAELRRPHVGNPVKVAVPAVARPIQTARHHR